MSLEEEETESPHLRSNAQGLTSREPQPLRKSSFEPIHILHPPVLGDLPRTGMLCFMGCILAYEMRSTLQNSEIGAAWWFSFVKIPHDSFSTEVLAVTWSTGRGVRKCGLQSWIPSEAMSAATGLASHASAVRGEAWLASNFIFQLKYDSPRSPIVKTWLPLSPLTRVPGGSQQSAPCAYSSGIKTTNPGLCAVTLRAAKTV